MTSKYETEAKGYTMTTVMQEAARCLLCEDAPCSQACPAHTNPAKFIRSVRFRNVKGAAETIRENNALGAICARVCPTERYCEKACTRAKIDHPIDIGGIQRYVTDMERKENMQILHAGKPNGMNIAIIGSGPAGLQAATTLLQKGYAVDIYEKNAKAGGYLTYGIPEYRLPESIVEYEVQRIVDLGAGTGAASWAAVAALETIETVHLVDYAGSALDLVEGYEVGSRVLIIQTAVEEMPPMVVVADILDAL